MRIDGSYLFPAPAERLFAALLRPEALAHTIPNTERLIQLGPPADDGGTTFKVWVRDASGLAVLTWCMTPVRRPASLRLKLWGHLPGGHVDGSGVIDLVPREDAHARAAYALELEAPEGALDAAAAQALAGALCERLAGLIYAPTPAEASASAPLPDTDQAAASAPAPSRDHPEPRLHGITPRGRIVLLPVSSPADGRGSVRLWAERVVWMGAGLALGLAAVSLVLAVAHRLNGHDT